MNTGTVRLLALVLSVVAVSFLSPSPASGDVQYQVYELDLDTASSIWESPSGEIVVAGDTRNASGFPIAHVQTFGQGPAVRIGTFDGGFYSFGSGVFGDTVIGISSRVDENGVPGARAYTYDRTTGVMQGFAGDTSNYSEARAVSRQTNGQMIAVGRSNFSPLGGPVRPCVWNITAGTTTSLSFAEGLATGVSTLGVISGFVHDDQNRRRAFRSQGPNGPLEMLNLPVGEEGGSEAAAVADDGTVVGSYYSSETGGGDRAFVYRTDGTVVFPNLLGGYGSLASINDDGVAVGQLLSPTTGANAMIWDPINGTRDLNDLIDPASGWDLGSASDISNGGHIIGLGRNAQGQSAAFLLVQVPGPGTALCATIMLSGLALRRNRR